LARQFAEAILTDDSELVHGRLMPAAEKRLKRDGLKKFLPRGWKSIVRELGTAEALPQTVEAQTIEAAFDEGFEGERVKDLAPDMPFESVRDVVCIYPSDPVGHR
jgi:hypothetical protein